MKIIILAGGGGTRLFPISRKSFPKQFMKVGSTQSLLEQTIKRFAGLVNIEDIIIVTNEAYYHHVLSELKTCGMREAHVLLEPAARNTAPAIGLAAAYCRDKLGSQDTEVLFVSPSDHLIEPLEVFHSYVNDGVTAAIQGHVVTFGVKPHKPETGYGYIKAGSPRSLGFDVETFKEKPDMETAMYYVNSGEYYWNSGMFAFSIGTVLAEFAEHCPDIFAKIQGTYADILECFFTMPNVSIDYAVAEKSRRVMVLPMTLNWNDVGSWDALYEVLPKDDAGNVTEGDCTAINCKNSFFLGRDRLIAGVGVEDIVVAETNDVIVVAKKGETQQIKVLVDRLKKEKRKEAEEHTTMYRPWGSFTVLGEGTGYKMKKITVEPGQSLSLQMHYHRSEHWIVTQGTARVTIGLTEKMVHENESVFVPKSTRHRLENPGRITLEIIEVQNGLYLEEDDIVRFDDIYGRVLEAGSC